MGRGVQSRAHPTQIQDPPFLHYWVGLHCLPALGNAFLAGMQARLAWGRMTVTYLPLVFALAIAAPGDSRSVSSQIQGLESHA